MAGLTVYQPNVASPNSSEEVDSVNATPATKVSAFSPSEVRESLNGSGASTVRSRIPPSFTITVNNSNFGTKKAQNGNDSSTGAQDPFVSTTKLTAVSHGSTNDTSKLSPVAMAFTPQSRQVLDSATSVGTGFFSGAPKSAHSDSSKQPAIAISVGNGIFLNKSDAGNSNKEKLLSASAFIANNPPVGLLHTGSPRRSGESFSSDDGASRSFLVFDVPRETTEEDISKFFDSAVFPSLKLVACEDLVADNCAFVRFGDIRDSEAAVVRIASARPGWKTQYIPTTYIVERFQPQLSDSSSLSPFEGQILITVIGSPKSRNADPRSISHLILTLLRKYGTVMAFEAVPQTGTTPTYRAEYCDVDEVDTLVATFGAVQLASIILKIEHYHPDLVAAARTPPGHLSSLAVTPKDTGIDDHANNMKVMHHETSLFQSRIHPTFLSQYSTTVPATRSLTSRKDLTGKHTPSHLDTNFNTSLIGSQRSPGWSPVYSAAPSFAGQSSIWSPSYSPGAIGQEREASILPSPHYDVPQQQARSPFNNRGRQHNDFVANQHNVVDVNRISEGTDVRTTIMLRNIPNKLDQAALKEIVDETSFGKYDFMYLRIDFANNCNVGYAFINFEDPYFIIEFMNARAGRRWNRFNSDKIAEVSYATIQGRDCLIQKFRNSSVMLEHSSFRPKIFFTGTGPLAGQEDAFPLPDNPSKMRRSIENAEHVGLFAPRAGQNFRDEQRRRRSQYDRGTRLAEIEDSFHTNHRFRGGGTAMSRRCFPPFPTSHF